MNTVFVTPCDCLFDLKAKSLKKMEKTIFEIQAICLETPKIVFVRRIVGSKLLYSGFEYYQYRMTRVITV